MIGQPLRLLALELLDSDTAEPERHWNELLDGVWLIVDEFVHEGRRYFVAENACAARRVPLSAGERQLLVQRAAGVSVKALAIERGVSEATVSRRVRLAMTKLGVSGQAQLARVFASMADAGQLELSRAG